ncbi:SRPBCC family protein [Mycolicibacterium sp. HK-90]|uniref:SRPBCC family protein n=1 Tax=Mycolicibacterium sp. HK-90 TaxID=3056937 RepID=UPI00265A9854|nr:SRPBCC family protein [Mycolicibacterium sp. HK-90]WKG06059.1 SRPBCC family protein [Mycolicibacterium sp. HK-90]
MGSTRVTGHVNAARADVYRALIDAEAIAAWRVPAGMRSEVHEFDAREGGTFRISLHYNSPDAVGKSSAHTDTYHGRFVELVPNERVVETIEFESDDPAVGGVMTMTTTLYESADGTEVSIDHDGIPDAVDPGDNETGTRMALAALAEWVEQRG